MHTLRKASDRGHADHGWLVARHTFSFAEYHDPRHRGFRDLRVMNEDRIAPGRGFGTHPHRDMEIITLVLEGELEHKDSLDSSADGKQDSILRPGELQAMSAGTGVLHSESNPSATDPTHLYQIWIKPDRRGVTPRYQQRAFPDAEKQNRWRLVASPDGADDSLAIYQDARVYQTKLGAGVSLTHELAPGRHAWLQVLRGRLRIADLELAEGDGLAVSEEAAVDATAIEDSAAGYSEAILFDLP
ncbi:MAG: pirin family protein [Planctomycetota bacterium]